jgi:hygromycin-B 7''-O-kinase
VLPAVHTDRERDAVIGDETIIRAAVADLAARHGLAGRELSRYPEGSVPVYAVGDQHVIKLHPPAAAEAALTEAHVLEFLQGKLPVATPSLHAHGDYGNGWRFILMSQLPGEDLAKTWPQIPPAPRTASLTRSAGSWPRCTPWIPGRWAA